MNEDFILVHKTLFEYLNGIYGCDYFILAKQFVRSRHPSKSPDSKNVIKMSTMDSTQNSSNVKGTN